MGYLIGGVEREVDEEGYLLEPDFGDEAPVVIARAEGIELTEAHWEVIRFLRAKYQERGQTPNFRMMLMEFSEEVRPGTDSKYLYALFPGGPAKQGVRVAGLPKPFGKGGY